MTMAALLVSSPAIIAVSGSESHYDLTSNPDE